MINHLCKITLRATIALISILFFSSQAQAAVTVTAADGVIYEITSGMNVKVSVFNADQFQGAVFDITIPAQVEDVSVNAATPGPYTVTEIADGAFSGCTGLHHVQN